MVVITRKYEAVKSEWSPMIELIDNMYTIGGMCPVIPEDLTPKQYAIMCYLSVIKVIEFITKQSINQPKTVKFLINTNLKKEPIRLTLTNNTTITCTSTEIIITNNDNSSTTPLDINLLHYEYAVICRPVYV